MYSCGENPVVLRNGRENATDSGDRVRHLLHGQRFKQVFSDILDRLCNGIVFPVGSRLRRKQQRAQDSVDALRAVKLGHVAGAQAGNDLCQLLLDA